MAPTLVDSVSRRSQLITAAVVVALGLLVAFMVDVHPESLRIPAWVAYVAASAFVFAGLCLLASAITMTYRLQRWLGVAVTVSLFVVCAWVAFGPGPARMFSFAALCKEHYRRRDLSWRFWNRSHSDGVVSLIGVAPCFCRSVRRLTTRSRHPLISVFNRRSSAAAGRSTWFC